jgi:hypothetical protein
MEKEYLKLQDLFTKPMRQDYLFKFGDEKDPETKSNFFKAQIVWCGKEKVQT